MQPAPRGRQDQLDRGPVLSGLLGDLGKVADGQPFAFERQVIQRPPGRAGHMIGKLHLGAGSGAGLKGRGHLGKRDREAGPAFRVDQALLGGFEFPAGGASAHADVAAAAERVRGVGGKMTGHLGEVVVAGAAEAHRPRQRRGGRLGQVAQEGQARLLGGVLVVERLDRVAASVRPPTAAARSPRARARCGSGGAPRRSAGPDPARGPRREPTPGPRWPAGRGSPPDAARAPRSPCHGAAPERRP